MSLREYGARNRREMQILLSVLAGAMRGAPERQLREQKKRSWQLKMFAKTSYKRIGRER